MYFSSVSTTQRQFEAEASFLLLETVEHPGLRLAAVLSLRKSLLAAALVKVKGLAVTEHLSASTA